MAQGPCTSTPCLDEAWACDGGVDVPRSLLPERAFARDAAWRDRLLWALEQGTACGIELLPQLFGVTGLRMPRRRQLLSSAPDALGRPGSPAWSGMRRALRVAGGRWRARVAGRGAWRARLRVAACRGCWEPERSGRAAAPWACCRKRGLGKGRPPLGQRGATRLACAFLRVCSQSRASGGRRAAHLPEPPQRQRGRERARRSRPPEAPHGRAARWLGTLTRSLEQEARQPAWRVTLSACGRPDVLLGFGPRREPVHRSPAKPGAGGQHLWPRPWALPVTPGAFFSSRDATTTQSLLATVAAALLVPVVSASPAPPLPPHPTRAASHTGMPGAREGWRGGAALERDVGVERGERARERRARFQRHTFLSFLPGLEDRGHAIWPPRVGVERRGRASRGQVWRPLACVAPRPCRAAVVAVPRQLSAACGPVRSLVRTCPPRTGIELASLPPSGSPSVQREPERARGSRAWGCT